VGDGLVDTSVVVDWDDPAVVDALPQVVAISTITLAEPADGLHPARDPLERARRQARLQRVEALLDPLGFDVAAARSFGLVVAAVAAAGTVPPLARRRSAHRGRGARERAAALHPQPGDFAGLGALVTVAAVQRDHALVAGAAGAV
jgi:predicted nucleic acid-binding protein